MPIVVREPDQKDYELPEDGSYLGVIADVIDLGEVAGPFGVKPKVQIKWLIDVVGSNGFLLSVSAFYNASLHEKANLRKALKAILGADVSGEFDLEELLGINNQLVVQQNTTQDGKTYANVIAILKAPKGERLEIPADFERKIDRDGEKPKAAKPQLKQTAQVQRPAPAPVQEAPAPVRQTAPAPASAPATRAGTIRRARTVAPAPAVPAKTVNPAIAELRRQLAAAEADAPVSQEITDQDIPF